MAEQPCGRGQRGFRRMEHSQCGRDVARAWTKSVDETGGDRSQDSGVIFTARWEPAGGF